MTDLQPIDAIAVVLGYANSPDGELATESRRRCIRAAELYENHGYPIALTGGFAPHFNTSPHPHFEYLRRLLLSGGVPQDAILCTVPSANTVEDATLLIPQIRRYSPCRLVVITSDFHAIRAELVFRDVMATAPGLSLEMSIVTSDPETRTRHASHESRRVLEMKKLISQGGILRAKPGQPSTP